ncbi:MAG: type 4a pilus biogenesis protein PilO [bacterium]
MNKDIIALISLFVVIFVIWMYVLYIPQTNKNDELNNKIQTYKEMERKYIPDSEIYSMEERLDSLGTKIKNIKDQFYMDKAILDIGRQIEQIGNEYGLEFQAISLLNYEMLEFFGSGNDKQLTELPAQFKFQGEYGELANFLDSIDDFPFLVRFTDMFIFNDFFIANKLRINLIGKVVIAKSELNKVKGVTNENI